MTSLKYVAAAFAVALLPAVALATPEVPANPAIPGDGYQIPEVHTRAQPLESANTTQYFTPGDGYRAPVSAPVTAPQAPATNDDGSYPSHWRQN